MNLRSMWLRSSSLAILASACLATSSSAVIVVSSDEIWDGVANPRAGDGVTLAGGIYTIPDEILIDSGATIFLNASRFEQTTTPSAPITFNFLSGAGGLSFADSTSTIDVHNGDRFGPHPQFFTLNMLDNAIQGDGQIVNGPVSFGEVGKPFSLAINSSADVSFGRIDLSKRDSLLGAVDIVTSGAVSIGSISTSDIVDGGASGGSVRIQGESITLGDVDTRAFRLDGNADSGSVFLQALNPPAFDSGDALGNSAAKNIITLSGQINTNGPATAGPLVGGNVDITAVKVVLENGFGIDLGENATATVNAGEVISGFTETDLFMDMATSGLQANFNVAHSVVPEPATACLALLTLISAAGLGRLRPA